MKVDLSGFSTKIPASELKPGERFKVAGHGSAWVALCHGYGQDVPAYREDSYGLVSVGQNAMVTPLDRQPETVRAIHLTPGDAFVTPDQPERPLMLSRQFAPVVGHLAHGLIDGCVVCVIDSDLVIPLPGAKVVCQ